MPRYILNSGPDPQQQSVSAKAKREALAPRYSPDWRDWPETSRPRLAAGDENGFHKVELPAAWSDVSTLTPKPEMRDVATRYFFAAVSLNLPGVRAPKGSVFSIDGLMGVALSMLPDAAEAVTKEEYLSDLKARMSRTHGPPLVYKS